MAFKTLHELSFYCPQCHQKSVYDDDTNVYTYDDINNDDYMQCNNCGAGYYAFRSETGLKLLSIEEHEFDNDPIGSGKPASTTIAEDKPIFTTSEPIKYSTLVGKLTTVTKDFITQHGVSAKDAVNHYTVDVSLTEDGDYYSIQIHADLDHDDMVELSEILDDIIEDVDPNASWSMDGPGMMSAYLPKTYIASSASISAASYNYGGAYDIDPFSFWTRDDLDDFGDAVAQNVHSLLYRHGYGLKTQLMLTGAFLEDDNRTITLEFEDHDGNTYSVSNVIDMRKIRKPSDLISRYTDEYTRELISQYQEYHDFQ